MVHARFHLAPFGGVDVDVPCGRGEYSGPTANGANGTLTLWSTVRGRDAGVLAESTQLAPLSPCGAGTSATWDFRVDGGPVPVRSSSAASSLGSSSSSEGSPSASSAPSSSPVSR